METRIPPNIRIDSSINPLCIRLPIRQRVSIQPPSNRTYQLINKTHRIPSSAKPNLIPNSSQKGGGVQPSRSTSFDTHLQISADTDHPFPRNHLDVTLTPIGYNKLIDISIENRISAQKTTTQEARRWEYASDEGI